MKRAFVTGGSGFVGRNLIAGLLEQGVAVRGLARSDTAERAVEKAGAEPVRGDLDSMDAMRAGMDGCDVVFHAAAVVTTWGDPKHFHHVNVQGTKNVIQAARDAGVPRLVHVSTEALLGGDKPIVNADETWPYPKKPAGLYPLTKGQAERAVIEANGDGLTTVAVRPPLIWGAGDTSVLPQMIQAIEAGQWMWFGGGHYPHTTTHVRNVVEGLLLAAEKGRGGEVYFVTDGPARDFRDFFEALFATRGVEAPDKTVPLWLAKLIANITDPIWTLLRAKNPPPVPKSLIYILAQELSCKDDKARRELGYEGKVSFEEGLAEMKAERASA